MDYNIIFSLISLVLLEVILGIDNIIFISIVSAKLPIHEQKKARRLGLFLAALLRCVLLLGISWIMQLKYDLFEVFEMGFSGKDLILILGGLFLLYKSTKEIHHKMEGVEGDTSQKINVQSFSQVILQILLLDVIFSVDSIITAVGMVKEVWVMYVAVAITMIIMLVAAEPISRFIDQHPAFKMLALAFLLLIGFTLIAEGFAVDIPKGYIYFAMAFSFVVDVLQMRTKNPNAKPVDIHEHYKEGEEKTDKTFL